MQHLGGADSELKADTGSLSVISMTQIVLEDLRKIHVSERPVALACPPARCSRGIYCRAYQQPPMPKLWGYKQRFENDPKKASSSGFVSNLLILLAPHVSVRFFKMQLDGACACSRQKPATHESGLSRTVCYDLTSMI